MTIRAGAETTRPLRLCAHERHEVRDITASKLRVRDDTCAAAKFSAALPVEAHK